MKMSPKTRNFFNQYGGWIAALLYIAMGVLLLVNVDLSQKIVIYAVALACALIGTMNLISYLKAKPAPHSDNYGLASGLGLILTGAAVCIWPSLIIGLWYVIISWALFANGMICLQTAFDTRRAHAARWWVYLAAASVSFAFGVLVLLLVGNATVLGILLVLEGLLNAALIVFRKVIEEPAAEQPAAEEPAEAAASEEAEDEDEEAAPEAPVSTPAEETQPEAAHTAPELPFDDPADKE